MCAQRHGKTEQCSGCGLVVQGGTVGCQTIVDELWAREFRDVSYFRVHRMAVDTYSLQYPGRYCASAKSLAAHLTGLCWLLEQAGSRAVGSESLRRWLDGTPRIEKPEVPLFRGRLTVADVREASEPDTYARAVEAWHVQRGTPIPACIRWHTTGFSRRYLARSLEGAGGVRAMSADEGTRPHDREPCSPYTSSPDA